MIRRIPGEGGVLDCRTDIVELREIVHRAAAIRFVASEKRVDDHGATLPVGQATSCIGLVPRKRDVHEDGTTARVAHAAADGIGPVTGQHDADEDRTALVVHTTCGLFFGSFAIGLAGRDPIDPRIRQARLGELFVQAEYVKTVASVDVCSVFRDAVAIRDVIVVDVATEDRGMSRNVARPSAGGIAAEEHHTIAVNPEGVVLVASRVVTVAVLVGMVGAFRHANLVLGFWIGIDLIEGVLQVHVRVGPRSTVIGAGGTLVDVNDILSVCVSRVGGRNEAALVKRGLLRARDARRSLRGSGEVPKTKEASAGRS